MKAVLVEGPSVRWGQVADPVPGPGEVAIAVRASAVNRADLLQRRGLYPPPEGASPILGLECSGTVRSWGPGVQGFSVGDRVCALLSGGGYAEIVTCPVAQVLPVPASLDLVHAAALPEALATAWMALKLVGELAAGERVLLHAGASGIGTAMIQVCRAWGHPCFVTCGSEEKIARCVALGADGGALRSGWESAVHRWAPDGVHVIVDPVGQGYVEIDQRVLARGGRIVLIGMLGGMQSQVDLARLLIGQQRLAGTTLRSRPAAEKARIMQGVARDIWPLVESGQIVPIIDRILPISETDEAHAVVARNETVGKVVLALEQN